MATALPHVRQAVNVPELLIQVAVSAGSTSDRHKLSHSLDAEGPAQVAAIASKLEALIRKQSILRARDLSARGIPRSYLKRLHARRAIEKLGPGLYVDVEFEATENHSMVEAAKRVAHGVICLRSALRFHGLTTQAPFQVWLAIDGHALFPPRQN